MNKDALPERFGRYALMQQLARGGMGEVFLARVVGAHGFEKKVAVKRILPQFAANERFRRMLIDEAKTSCFLNHPNIAQVLELGEVTGQLFLVMEYVPGHSLSEMLKALRKKGEKLSVLEAVFIGLEMCQGLHAAHTQADTHGRPLGIIHRDVSPQNLLLSHDGLVKVIDFGIARARDRLETTEAGAVKGKVHYMAPEQLSPDLLAGGEVDHRVDIFAAGVVIWEALAGRRLFKGKNLLNVIEKVLLGEIPDLRDEGVDDELWAIVSRALERDRLRRWPDAGKLAAALRGYLYTRDPEFTSSAIAARMEDVFGPHQTLDSFEVTAQKEAPASMTASRTPYSDGVVEQEPTPFTPTGSFAQAQTATLHASMVEGAPTRVLVSSPGGGFVEASAPHAAAPPRRRTPLLLAASVVLGLIVAGGAIIAFESGSKDPLPVVEDVPPVAEPPSVEVTLPVASPPAIEAPAVETPPVEAPPPAPAKLRVQVTPTDAKISVLRDGVILDGSSKLESGDEIVVRAERRGYLPQEARVKVTAGVEHFVALTLVEEQKAVVVERPAPRRDPPKVTRSPRKRGKGTLILSTGNEWAEVTIDGAKQKQVTPMRLRLSAGRHKVVLTNPITKRSRTFSVTIKVGEELRKDVTLQ